MYPLIPFKVEGLSVTYHCPLLVSRKGNMIAPDMMPPKSNPKFTTCGIIIPRPTNEAEKSK